MGKPRPEKKREEKMPTTAPPAEERVLPMQLQLGDRLVEERASSGRIHEFGLVRSSLFVPQLKALDMERYRNRGRRRMSRHQHHQLAACDEMIASSTRRVVPWAPWNRRRDAIVRQASVTEPETDDAAQTRRHELLSRVVEHDFGLTHQHVRPSEALAALFDKSLGGRPWFLGPAPLIRRQRRAAIQMGAHGIGKVLMAVGAQIRADEQFVLPEAPGTGDARPDDVVPAVLVEERTLFAADPARPAAVKVDHALAVAFDGVLGPERLQAARAR
jgi:hypothetical protein